MIGATRGTSANRVSIPASKAKCDEGTLNAPQVALLGVAFALRVLSPDTASFAYLLLAIYALLGTAHSIRALALSWLFSALNPGITPDAATAMERYVVLAAAAGSVAWRTMFLSGLPSRRVGPAVIPTLFLGCFFVVHSLFFSTVHDLSVLKALSWTVAACTSFAAWAALSQDGRILLGRQIFVGLTSIALASLPLLIMPLGYLRNDAGFQGILNQPQAFGLVMAILGAWAGSWILADSKPNWTGVALFGVCMALVVWSKARTAGMAMVLALLLASLTGAVLGRRSLRQFLPGLRSGRVYLLIVLSIVSVVLAGSALMVPVTDYLSKGSGLGSISDAYEGSRGTLIEQMWANIEEQPFQGIGFGIASDPNEMLVERDGVFGFPISASIEKGVMPIAVLEEVGIFGLIATALWLWVLTRHAARGGGMEVLAVAFTLLLLNAGENMLFSPNGFGLLVLVLLGWTVTQTRGLSSTKHA